MTDSTYLRAYGDKTIYTGGGILTTTVNISGIYGYADATAVGSGTTCRSTSTVFGYWITGHCSSLARYKDEVQDIPYDLGMIRQLRPVKYKWNIDDRAYDIGFIAEEVNAVNPIFNEYSDGVLSGVKYSHLVALAIKGIQVLDVQVQDIDTRLAVIESGEFAGDIHVTADAEIDGTLTVAGNTELQGDLKVLGNTEVQQLTVNGKIITAGDTPTATLGAYTIVGENSTVTVTGNDTAGTLTYTAGSVNLPTYDLSQGGQASVTFVAPFTVAPRIALTPKDQASAVARYYVTTTETGFTINFLDPPTTASTYTFDYIVIQ